jgi:Choline dehydrogenase and related flavoproteins
VCLLNPRSRGTIKLSGSSVNDPLLIDPNFLGDEQDLEDLVQGFKLTQQLMMSPSLSSHYQQDLFTSLVKTMMIYVQSYVSVWIRFITLSVVVRWA